MNTENVLKLDEVRITPMAAKAIPRKAVIAALARLVERDWGDVGPQGQEINDRFLATGCGPVTAMYTEAGIDFWVALARSGHALVFLPRVDDGSESAALFQMGGAS